VVTGVAAREADDSAHGAEKSALLIIQQVGGSVKSGFTSARAFDSASARMDGGGASPNAVSGSEAPLAASARYAYHSNSC
jgi:hypothetical protein